MLHTCLYLEVFSVTDSYCICVCCNSDNKSRFQFYIFLVYCKKSFEDDPDVTEEEIEEELGIIR